ncbi:MAG: M15 family metallopeptidase [Candidatus Saccharibacteria bacterium]|nr:M15 family metallopeptidase [Candidatus Saccharibacteria bacterium]
MARPQLDYETDKQADSRLNPGEREFYNEAKNDAQIKTSSSLHKREQDALSDYTNSTKNATDLPGRESVSGFYTPERTDKNNKAKFSKKKATIISLVIGGVGGGGILTGFFGSAMMLPSLKEALTFNNDSSSIAMERRFMKVFANATKSSDNTLCASSKKMKCRMGKLSNSSLRRLAKKGIHPVIDGKKLDVKDIKRTGYPSKSASHFDIDGKRISSKDLVGYLNQKENRHLAAKVLGRRGAFNMRVRAWVGKNITKRLFKKFGLNKNGGLADSKLGKNVKERVGKLREKLKAKMPGAGSADAHINKAKAKVEKITGKAKKGGAGYMIAAGGCIAVKAPKIVAGTVAAIQLAQIIGHASDFILSPGDKAKASGFGSGFSQEDANAIGTALTERKPRKSDGKLSSALDSRYLKNALGIDKSKPKISNFTPGFSILTNDAIKAGVAAENATKDACNVILSPAAMYAAMAVDTAATVAASTTLIGGLVKVVVSWTASELISAAIKAVATTYAKDAIENLAKNDAVPTAEGEDLGDIIGISATAFFSSGGMARNLPALTTSGAQAFHDMKLESEQLHKEMDIASLSPFDISSKHTALGSIVHNAGYAMLTNGMYGTNGLGLLGGLLRIPGYALSSRSLNAQAAPAFSEKTCGYAKEFELESVVNGRDLTPAINVAGLPCTGITRSQDAMSTEEAIQLLEQEGWIEDVDIPDGADIDTLVESGYIKKDTPLHDFIESCSDASSGDYLFNAAGCIVDDGSTEGSLSQVANNMPQGVCDTKTVDGNSTNVCASADLQITEADGVATDVEGLKNQRSMAAISVFLLDFQVAQSINGEDDDSDEGAAAATSIQFQAGTPENVKQLGNGWSLKENTDYSSVQCAAGTGDGGTYEVRIGTETSKIRVCNLKDASGEQFQVASLISENIKQMFEAANKDGIKLTSQSSFRSLAEQQQLYNQNCSGGQCNPPTSPPGNSQHELGLAVDWGVGGRSFCYPASACPGNPGYDWMMKNAQKYGFHKLDSEGWHFSTSGH